ncbi:MAG: DUF4271 domain-containing protein [Bacteroidales bacterium]|nr:DUF4271 domain-containing protein [Bacteroidales bacterium]
MNGDSTFVTSGFEGIISPMVRVTHEVLEGWNLIILAAALLLVVINKQLYPRQFRQLLSVPGGVAHTNQLLREWTPTSSFIGFSFTIAYIAVIALFLQKAFVIFSNDLAEYNGFNMFAILCAIVAGWVVLRHLVLALIGWLFRQKEVVMRQNTVELSASTFCFLVMEIILLLVLYIPNSIFVWVGIGIIFATALVKLILDCNETRVFSKMPTFYIFLYFCTLEIAPLVLLLTAGMRYFTNNTVF